jgi:hypothetical protein
VTRRLHDSGFFAVSLPRTITPIDPAKARARQQLRALVMHIRLGNVRHRPMLDKETVSRRMWDPGIAHGRTACDETLAGKPYACIDAGYTAVFPTGERVELCTNGCFSPAELRVAEELQHEEDERLAEKAAREEADRVEANERALFEREQAKKRVDDYKRTAEMAPLPNPDPKEKK